MRADDERPARVHAHAPGDRPGPTAARTLAWVSWPVEWEAVSDMQHFASRYAQRYWSGDLADRARLSACELLDNAARYATAGSSIELTIAELGTGFDVRVTNDSVEPRIEILRRRIREMTAADVGDIYRKALRRVLTLETSAGAGLGLLRVRHEANVDLDLHVEGRRVTVSARGTTANDASPGVRIGQRHPNQRQDGNGSIR